MAVSSSQESTILSVLLILLLFFAFVVSGAKIAYFALDSKDIDVLKTKQKTSYRRVLELLESSRPLYVSLQMATYFFYLAIIIIGILIKDTLLSNTTFNDIPLAGISTSTVLLFLCLVLLFAFFCELLPKLYAYQNPIRFAKDFSLLVQGIYYIFGRSARWMILSATNIESAFFKKRALLQEQDEDLDHAIDSYTERTSSEEEKNILKGIVRFSTIKARQIMKPRLDIDGVDITIPFNELLNKIKTLNYSRLPVYKSNLDNIMGIINTKDIVPYLNEKNTFQWQKLLLEPFFIHENKLIEELLHEFQSSKRHIAIVVDEFGGTSGLVTVEDVQEEIIGEIKDEFDQDEKKFKKISDTAYSFDGKITIIEMCRIMGLPTDTFDQVKGESDTISGLIFELAKDIPKKGQVIATGDFKFTILELEHNRMEKIQVDVLPDATKD